VLIAYTVKDRPNRKAVWTRIGVAFPHDKGAGLTVILDAMPLNFDGRIVLVEPKLDGPAATTLPPAPGRPAFVRDDHE
jgi:hypothetical protein